MQASFSISSRGLMSTSMVKTIRVAGATYLRGAIPYASGCIKKLNTRDRIFTSTMARNVTLLRMPLDTGVRLAGDLDRRYDKAISAWIAKSQERLFNIWTAIQSSIDPEFLIADLQGDDW